MDIKAFGKTVLSGAKKHSPELLVCLGVAGFIGTVVMAVKATPKALEILETEEKIKGEPLTKKEVVKATWKCYIPTLVTGGTAIACIFGGTRTSVKRNAALAAAYTASEQSMKLYREKVIETIGDKKEKLVRDEVSKEMIAKNPPQNNQVIITPKGKTLCYEPLSDRYFEGDIESIKRGIDRVNKILRDEMSANVNDYFYNIGLPANCLGDLTGWSVDDYPLEPHYSSQLTDDDRPCFVINMPEPTSKY